MKIGVDAATLGLSTKVYGGNYHLALNLLINLSKVDRKNDYFLYSYSPIPQKVMRKMGGNFINVIIRPVRFWLQIGVVWELLQRPVDVFLGLNQAVPVFLKCPKVVFILDLAHLKFPQMNQNVKKLSLFTMLAAKIAAKIIAISQNTKKDLIKFYNIKETKITTIYLSF